VSVSPDPGRVGSAVFPGPPLDEPVPHGGYRWHYLDAVTEDGRLGIVLIAMVGNPFSPGYARARALGVDADPWRFTSMNVAVYGRGVRESAWAFAERAQRPDTATPDRLLLGASALAWDGGRLVATLDERTTPLGPLPRRPVRGRVVFHPATVCDASMHLDAERQHRWWPIAPMGWVEVDLVEPELRFAAHGYLDANHGTSPLDASFDRWCWARARVQSGSVISYDVTMRDGSHAHRAFRVLPDGVCSPFEGLVRSSLGRTAWGIPRHAATSGPPPRRLRTLEDGPFYAREIWEAEIAGDRTTVVHETLSAKRLRQSWVQFCTAYRMRVE
jgi:carotenoid 1,2-hydratase